MKNSEPASMRDVPLGEARSSQFFKRKSFFVRLVEALHVSRRRDARRVLRRYRHLIAPDFRGGTGMIAPECNTSKQKEADANRDQTFDRAIHRALEHA